MDKKLCYVLGTVFIIAGGVLYSLERFIAYFAWIGQMIADPGYYSSSPHLPGVLTNIFVPLFIIIGVLFFIFNYKKSTQTKS